MHTASTMAPGVHVWPDEGVLLNIKQITYMVTVVKCGSLSAAAKELYVTVQAVSKAIADLEREVGHRLFVRESHGVRPTPFGIAFNRKAEKVMESFHELEEFAQTYDEGDKEQLNSLHMALNTPPFPGYEVVCENTASLLKSQMGLEVVIEQVMGRAGLEGLHAGTYDALITVGAFNHSTTTCCAVGTVPAGVLVRKDHALAQKDHVSVADLEPYPIALADWFHEANETIVSEYSKRAPHLNFVDLGIDDIGPFLLKDGILFTTGIPAFGRALPGLAMRMMTAEDAVMSPICIVCLKERSSSILSLVKKLKLGDVVSLLG